MSETTAEDPTEGTSSVEGRGVHLNPLAGLGGRRDKEIILREYRRGGRRFVEIGVRVEHLVKKKRPGGERGGGVEEAGDQGMLWRLHSRW